MKGMAYMVLSGFSFTLLNAGVHHAAQELPPVQVAFLRSFFALLVLTGPFLRYGLAPLRTRRLGLHVVRGLLNAVAMMLVFYALGRINLETNAALGFSAPLFAALMALLFLGETFRWRRLGALVVGFSGAVVILRPGFAEPGWGEGAALLGAAVWGAAMVVIKILARTESSLTSTLYMVLVTTPVTLVASVFVWEAPRWELVLLLAGVGVVGAFSHWAIAQAFRYAEVGALTPLDFVKLMWATLIGYAVFSESPDPWTWVGGTMIFAAGIYVAHRERLAARRGESTDDVTPPPERPAPAPAPPT